MKIPAFPAAVKAQKCQRRQEFVIPHYPLNPFILYAGVVGFHIFSDFAPGQLTLLTSVVLQYFLGHVAAWCKICQIQLCKNFMENLTVFVVIFVTVPLHISLIRLTGDTLHLLTHGTFVIINFCLLYTSPSPRDS